MSNDSFKFGLLEESLTDVPIAEEDGNFYPIINSKLPACSPQPPVEAERMSYGGRSLPSLKESKTFDTERLADLPLFAQKGRLF